MYLDYFNFKEEPFNNTPDPKFLYLSRQHESAIESLMYGIAQRKGFMAMIGDIGTGKTTITRALVNQLDKNIDVSVIFNPMLSVHELLQAVNDDFGNKSATKEDTVKGQIDALNDFLLRRLRWKKNAVVVIDEAQNLSIESMEMMRLLSNLETENKKLIQIIFVGQKELGGKLDSPDLRQLNQRIGIRCYLNPLMFTDTCQYIIHRLQVAVYGGMTGVRFEEKALRAAHKYSGGTPRLINMICDRALLEAFACKERVVTKHIVDVAIDDLQGPLSLAGAYSKKKRPWQFWKWFQ